MAFSNKNLIDFGSFQAEDILNLFGTAENLRLQNLRTNPQSIVGTAGLLFFENSTRTRLSFESACFRCGLGPILIDCNSGSSLVKGETPEDTVLNVAALSPSVLIIRAGESVDLDALASKLEIPVINAGWGSKGHPTQALLDLYTIWRHRELKSTRLLIVGDIVHSRVASSHFEVFSKLGVEVGSCGPKEFEPKQKVSHLRWFSDLQKGLSWANAVMALRVQAERHESGLTFDSKAYFQAFGLSAQTLKRFTSEGLILHPGPVNHGVELATEVFSDPRCKILQQVNNGLFIRQAILKTMLGLL